MCVNEEDVKKGSSEAETSVILSFIFGSLLSALKSIEGHGGTTFSHQGWHRPCDICFASFSKLLL